jgi:hypothetical protein
LFIVATSSSKYLSQASCIGHELFSGVIYIS